MNILDFHIIQTYPALNDPEVLPRLPECIKNTPQALSALNETLEQIFRHSKYSKHFCTYYLTEGRATFKLAVYFAADPTTWFERLDVILSASQLKLFAENNFQQFKLDQIQEIINYLENYLID